MKPFEKHPRPWKVFAEKYGVFIADTNKEMILEVLTIDNDMDTAQRIALLICSKINQMGETQYIPN